METGLYCSKTNINIANEDKYLSNIVSKIAIDRHIEQRRSEYYSILHKVSKGKFHQEPQKYNLEPLCWFFIKVIEESLTDIETYENKYKNLMKLSEASLSVLNCFKLSPEKRIQVMELEKEINFHEEPFNTL